MHVSKIMLCINKHDEPTNDPEAICPSNFEVRSWGHTCSRLSLSRVPRDSIKYFKISVSRHINFAKIEKNIRTTTFYKYICNRTLEVRDILKRRNCSRNLSVVGCSCSAGTRFSLRDKRLFEISEFEITRVNCIRIIPHIYVLLLLSSCLTFKVIQFTHDHDHLIFLLSSVKVKTSISSYQFLPVQALFLGVCLCSSIFLKSKEKQTMCL